MLGLSWITPLLRAVAGDNPHGQMKEIWRLLGVPLLAIAAFLLPWGALAPKVQTSLGTVPTPAQVWTEAVNLHADAMQKSAKAAAFYDRLDERNQRLIEAGRAGEVREMAYTGAPSYCDHIWTSTKTVFFGFLVGSLIAIPLGILAGLSPTAMPR